MTQGQADNHPTTILGRARAWVHRLPSGARPTPPPAGTRRRRDRLSPGAAGSPPRSAPGRRTPRYHSLRDLT